MANEGSDFGKRLDGAKFVVGEGDGNELGFVGDFLL